MPAADEPPPGDRRPAELSGGTAGDARVDRGIDPACSPAIVTPPAATPVRTARDIATPEQTLRTVLLTVGSLALVLAVWFAAEKWWWSRGPHDPHAAAGTSEPPASAAPRPAAPAQTDQP